ncbi:MAG: hypothetical protein HY235_26110 [Acidobacteria bacterium]|nr:hypothetical protein [Acidobacteriota bacterium]
MTSTDYTTIFAYLVTSACAVTLSRRSSNWRIRLLTLVLGVVPICQLVMILSYSKAISLPTASVVAEAIQWLISVFCLSAVHLINRENTDREQTEVRLRLAEASGPFLAGGISDSLRSAMLPVEKREPAVVQEQTPVAQVSESRSASRCRRTSHPAMVTVFDADNHSVPCVVEHLQDRSMRIVTEACLPPDVAVKIAVDNLVLLGSVRACQERGAGHDVYVELNHCVDLMRLSNLLVEERRASSLKGSPIQPPVSFAHLS